MTAELRFWLWFLVLNTLFFLPRYLLEFRRSTFLPYRGLLQGSIADRIRFLINRYNYDIFRVSFDFFTLAFLYFFIHSALPYPVWVILVSIVYLILLTYQAYYHVFEGLYQVEPLFYSDRHMLYNGFQVFVRGFDRQNLLLLLGTSGLLVIIFLLLGHWLTTGSQATPGWLTYGLALLIFPLGLYSLVTYNYKAFGKIVFPSQIQSLWRNLRRSQAARRRYEALNLEQLIATHPFRHFQLKKKPNIYLIVVESYGQVLYDHPELWPEYQVYATELSARLQSTGWLASTAFSLAPITGGASWLSYSSLLYGLRIGDQGTFQAMLNDERAQQYPHLMRLLRDQGYTNYRLVSLPQFEGMVIPWETYARFYAIDRWIRAEDINFRGETFGFGPCPPDQYALHFAHHKIKEDGQQPFFLFFITQNSHSPFDSPEKPADNWEDLYDASVPTAAPASLFQRPRLADYRKAIRYQLHYLCDFIAKQGGSNDLFILIGDHQPPVFPGPEASPATPVHIITRDPAMAAGLARYGFQDGLITETKEPPFQHENLYTVILRELWQHYGPPDSPIPDIQLTGLSLNT